MCSSSPAATGNVSLGLGAGLTHQAKISHASPAGQQALNVCVILEPKDDIVALLTNPAAAKAKDPAKQRANGASNGTDEVVATNGAVLQTAAANALSSATQRAVGSNNINLVLKGVQIGISTLRFALNRVRDPTTLQLVFAASVAFAALRALPRSITRRRARGRAHAALRSRDPALLIPVLAPSAHPRSVCAALAALAHDARDASNRRIEHPSTANFPVLSDRRLAAGPTWPPHSCSSCGASVTTTEGCVPTPSTLSVASDAVSGRVTGSSNDYGERPGGSAPLSCGGTSLSNMSSARSDSGVSVCQSAASDAIQAREVRGSGAVSPRGPPPPEGLAAALLLEEPLVATSVANALLRLLAGGELAQQRDAARVIQALSFIGDEPAQMLIDAGLVPLLVAALQAGHGTRRRGACHLRQPGPRYLPHRYLPSASHALVSLTSSLHPVVTTPKGAASGSRADLRLRSTKEGTTVWDFFYWKLRGACVQLGAVNPVCGLRNEVREAAAAALQNLCALRSGCKAFLDTPYAVEALCSSVVHTSYEGMLATVEVVHSIAVRVPERREELHARGAEHVPLFVEAMSGCPVIMEAVYRARLRLDAFKDQKSSSGHHIWC